MDSAVERTLETLHRRPFRCVIAIAGPGSQAIAWLLRVPGASSTLIEALVLYSHPALASFLGAVPKRAVSPETAAAMARRAFDRARALFCGDPTVMGVACTGALATNRPRRGAHSVEIAVSAAGPESALPPCASYSLVLQKGARSRGDEEDVCSLLLLQALALSAGVVPAFTLPLLPDEQVHSVDPISPIAALLEGRTRWLLVAPDGSIYAEQAWPGAILSGAFNPLHAGHRRLAEVAAQMLGKAVCFEISVDNVDKGTLSAAELLHRVRQFSGWGHVALTRARTFREKARLFPGATFVVGFDTAARIVAPRYYGSTEDMHVALHDIRRQGASFLVAGRLHEGVYRTLADLTVPPGFDDLFRPIPDTLFRLDLSSTELRRQAGEAGAPNSRQSAR